MIELKEKKQKVGEIKNKYFNYIKKVLNTPVSLPFIQPRLKSSNLMDLTAKLAAMTEAGLPVIGSLRLLAGETNSSWLKNHIEMIAEQVETGFSLSESFGSRTNIFPPIFINMIKAGETTGRLDIAFQRLTFHFDKQHNLEQKVRSATAYPKFIAVVLTLVVFFLFTFVVPSFEGVFQSMRVELPMITRAIIYIGEIMANYWYFFIGTLSLLFLFFQWILRTEKGIYVKDKLFFSIPFYGTFYRKLLVARFCRTLGTMLGSGIDVLMALDLSGKVTNNRVFEDRLVESRVNIVRGYTMADSLSRTGFFPPMVIGLVNTGEQTGTLEKMLGRTALFYEQDVEHTLNRLSSILEPVLILFMALIVGIVIISILLPMFELFSYF